MAGWVKPESSSTHTQFLCQFYELRKLNTHTGVEGCGVVVLFGKYTYIALLVLLFGCPQPIDRLTASQPTNATNRQTGTIHIHSKRWLCICICIGVFFFDEALALALALVEPLVQLRNDT